jgi:hypothetical protein
VHVAISLQVVLSMRGLGPVLLILARWVLTVTYAIFQIDLELLCELDRFS